MNGQSAAAFDAAKFVLMTSIGLPDYAPRLSENRVVTLVSRVGAIALAAVVVALISMVEIETPDDGLGAPVVNVFLSAPERRLQQPRVVPPQPTVAENAEAVIASAGDTEDWPHLWTYDARGRIVLRTNEQLVRCTNARRQAREESDCPDSNERTPMISRES